MKKYDYEEAITNDIIDYIKDNNVELDWTTSDDSILEYLADILWYEACITGNDCNGSYYDTEENCEKYLAYNLKISIEACEEFCVTMKKLLEQYHNNTLARYLDSTIRCYLLDNCIAQTIEILKKEEYEKFFRELDGD